LLLTVLTLASVPAVPGSAEAKKKVSKKAPAEDEEKAEAPDDDKPRDEEGSRDHPGVKRYPGSLLYGGYVEKEFESTSFPVGNRKSEKAEGKYYLAEYKFPPGASCTQVIRNYENAFKAAGMRVIVGNASGVEPGHPLFDGADAWVTGIGKGKTGGKVYMAQGCSDYQGQYVSGHLCVIETQAMQQKVEITADFMAEEIEKTGRIALYGINFATGKADITPDSAVTLEQIAELLQKKPGWKIRIEGHTDTVGNAKANLDLSVRRAQAVKQYLVEKQGVAGNRLTTDGLGGEKPVADNKSEDGRAKNRRVELVKL
jgi:outer membrane protein OmpA-like peptidoglycan-associated protein